MKSLSEAAEELAQFIIDNKDAYTESLGLAILDFNDRLYDEDTPAMALAFAKKGVKYREDGLLHNGLQYPKT